MTNLADLPIDRNQAQHTVEVGLYGLAYRVSIDTFGLGGFGGQPVAGFEDGLYFSAVTYTSLGLGDYYPTGNLRLIAVASIGACRWPGTTTRRHPTDTGGKINEGR